MSDTVLGTGDTVGSKNDMALVLKELTFWWGKTDNKEIFLKLKIISYCNKYYTAFCEIL